MADLCRPRGGTINATHLLNRLGLITLAALLSGALVGTAAGQLSDAEIEALRDRAAAEGWTFNVGPTPATAVPLETLTGLVQPDDWAEGATFDMTQPVLADALPRRFDWREHAGVTPIRNQGGCGSCWAFAAMGAVEASARITTGARLDLSEQWLVSCTNAGDCGGGWHTTAMRYMDCSGYTDSCGRRGAVHERDLPYEGADTACACPLDRELCLDRWAYVGSGMPAIAQIKEAILNYGPVATTVASDSAFGAYQSGVFNAWSSTSINHAVVLVGWDDDLGTSGCWILRNSWGTGWGMAGYMYIEYGCNRVGYTTAYAVVEEPPDCNDNGYPDHRDLLTGTTTDCNGNGIPDECDIAAGVLQDCNADGIPDACQLADGTFSDCNANGLADECEIIAGTQQDCDSDGMLDSCAIGSGAAADCDGNGVPDSCDLAAGAADCDADGLLDACALKAGYALAADTPVYGWIEIGLTGPALPLSDADTTVFPLAYSNALAPHGFVIVGANGGVGFGGHALLADLNAPLPSQSAFMGDRALLAYWDDLLRADGKITALTLGRAPQRFTIIEWYSVDHAPLSVSPISFQIQLYETPIDGVTAQVLYFDTNFDQTELDDGASASIGFQESATDGAPWTFNSSGAVRGGDVLSLRWRPAAAPDANGNGVPDTCELQLGDVNCDGVIDTFDIDPFMTLLSDEPGYLDEFPDCPPASGDINGDGQCDTFDIDGFIALLGG